MDPSFKMLKKSPVRPFGDLEERQASFELPQAGGNPPEWVEWQSYLDGVWPTGLLVEMGLVEMA